MLPSAPRTRTRAAARPLPTKPAASSRSRGGSASTRSSSARRARRAATRVALRSGVVLAQFRVAGMGAAGARRPRHAPARRRELSRRCSPRGLRARRSRPAPGGVRDCSSARSTPPTRRSVASRGRSGRALADAARPLRARTAAWLEPLRSARCARRPSPAPRMRRVARYRSASSCSTSSTRCCGAAAARSACASSPISRSALPGCDRAGVAGPLPAGLPARRAAEPHQPGRPAVGISAARPGALPARRRRARARSLRRAASGSSSTSTTACASIIRTGIVDPWVYRDDDPDPLHAVQHGARLFGTPSSAEHPSPRRFRDRNRRRSRSGSARRRPGSTTACLRLTSAQVDRYATLFDALMELARARGCGVDDIACEVLSTLPYPLGARARAPRRSVASA